jgi:hypothetical protein
MAQGGTSTASRSGKVTDATGGVLPGVTVTVTSLATNQNRTIVTNEEGVYRFAGLQPGLYAVNADLEGFAKFVQTNVALNVGSAVDLNVAMRVSTMSETVTVSGQAPIIESAKMDLSSGISRDQIETLPTISRNFLDYALLTPGVNEDVRTTGQGIGLKVAGARDKDGALLVDGLWNTDESFTYPKVKYSQDAIAEFQVENIGGAAEFGRSVGGIVSAVTKSGTNSFSGSGYGYFRNKELNSEDFLSAQQGLPKAQFDREQWGGSVGGPIARSRTFFFAAADRSTQNTPFNNSITAQNAAIIGLPAADVGNVNQFLNDTFLYGEAYAHREWEQHADGIVRHDVRRHLQLRHAVRHAGTQRVMALHRQHGDAAVDADRARRQLAPRPEGRVPAAQLLQHGSGSGRSAARAGRPAQGHARPQREHHQHPEHRRSLRSARHVHQARSSHLLEHDLQIHAQPQDRHGRHGRALPVSPVRGSAECDVLVLLDGELSRGPVHHLHAELRPAGTLTRSHLLVRIRPGFMDADQAPDPELRAPVGWR